MVWEKGKKAVILLVGFLFAAGLAAVCTSFAFAFDTRDKVYVKDAHVIYENEVKGYVKLPPGAKVERVSKNWIGDTYRLTVRMDSGKLQDMSSRYASASYDHKTNRFIVDVCID